MQEWNNIGEESHALCAATLGISPDGTVFPVRCKKWSCKICAPINAYYAAIKTANGVYALFTMGLRPKFATITQPGSIKTPTFAYRILHTQWDKFRNRWQYWARTMETPNTYAAFVEGQSRRSDMPHFHIVGTALPSKETLRDWAVSSGFGYEVDLQVIKPNAGVAWYVSKYSTKGSDAQYIPKGFRRCRYSQDFPDMYFRADLLEHTGIVRAQRETYAHWLVRAVRAFGIDPIDAMQQAQAIVDKTQDEARANYAAQTLIQVMNW